MLQALVNLEIWLGVAVPSLVTGEQAAFGWASGTAPGLQLRSVGRAANYGDPAGVPKAS